MLKLSGIQKIYHSAGEDVEALKGIDLSFRSSEFVAVLGPSGCGKTTLLNIIGGLDGFDAGDLIINGTSTKQYKSRDWDAYRNHSVGFVFQSYNLIPHQTVLSNVEMSLTLTGVGRKERRKRATEALEKVGLKSQLHKRPNAMSGGQCQRVAIARAIVNDPDIILADEPTGALDTETSVQVMEILKEISKDRLVIMVTHNPDLAAKYATRTVTMLDGRITGDSAPLTDADIKAEQALEVKRTQETKGAKLPSMSLLTSFQLSLQNLFTKKGRTLLTSFAGSIGIIGIALIYAVSQGTTDFIDSVQEETLSSYPITIEQQTVDTSSLITTFMGSAKSVSEHTDDAVYQKTMLYDMLNAFNSLEARENDLSSFKAYIDEKLADDTSALSQAVTGVQYSYDTGLTVYTKNSEGKVTAADAQTLVMNMYKEYLGIDMSTMYSMSSSTAMGSTYSSMMSSNLQLFKELVPGKDGACVNDVTQRQYNLLCGSWPNEYDELILFVDENNEITDLTLYALGLIPESEIQRLMDATMNGETVEYTAQSWSYQDIMNMTFKAVLPSDCYVQDETTGLWTDLRNTDLGLSYLYDNALTLRVVGIAKPNASAVSSSSNSSYLGYTQELTKYLINKAAASPAVLAQQATPDTDIFTGLPFAGESSLTDAEKAAAFQTKVASMTEAEKAAAYKSVAAVATDGQTREEYIESVLSGKTREELVEMALSSMAGQTGVSTKLIEAYISKMSDEDLYNKFSEAIGQQYDAQASGEAAAALDGKTDAELAALLDSFLKYADEGQLAAAYDATVKTSDSTYSDNLVTLGLVSEGTPSSISLYASSFENKDVITSAIAEYNSTVPEVSQLKYTDYVGLMMSSITTIINAITYVLMAFVAVSLIVSSIMIGVITLISVQERTKEIGILRAIGASKRNVSSLFNAETVLIGFSAGLVGVLITYILCIPINLILHKLTELNNLSASLPVSVAAILIAISVLLTLIAGIIPSRSASRKDPVVALRSE